MIQLTMPLREAPREPLEAVTTLLEQLGWVRDPTHRRPEPRFNLPGTAWYVRALYHTTTLYRRQGPLARIEAVVPTTEFARIRLLLELVALRAKRARRA